MNKSLNFGILGCGMIANFHADAIKSLKSATLAGVADVNAERAAEFGLKHGISVYKDFEEMLGDSNIDAVCICTPSGFHAENAVKAINAGKHVVLEKPMALGSKQAKELIAVCEKSGKLLTVISQLRFSEDVLKVKTAIENGSFGKLVMCDLYMKYWRSPQYYSECAWKGTRRFDGGGALINQGIHGIDLLTFMAGSARVIGAKCKTSFHDIEVEDTAVALLEFENGALGTVEASTCVHPGFSRRIEILGTNGHAILIENQIARMELGSKTVIEKKIEETGGSAGNPAGIGFEGHAKQINNFIKAVFGEEKLLVDPTEGARAVELIEQIYSFK